MYSGLYLSSICVTHVLTTHTPLPAPCPAPCPQVVHELLGTPEGCELYLLPPAALGCAPGEVLRFAELQAVGRLMQRTVIGVVAGGRVVLAPGREWRWAVQEGDSVAALALSWDC